MTCIKERVAWDYYYIEIVKCYQCLALNHQMESHRYHVETWKLWGACDVCECEKRIKCIRSSSGSPLFPWMFIFTMPRPAVYLWKWGSKYLKEEIRCWESSPATITHCLAIQFGGVTRLIWSGIINWRPGKFYFNFNDTISRLRSINPFSAA